MAKPNPPALNFGSCMHQMVSPAWLSPNLTHMQASRCCTSAWPGLPPVPVLTLTPAGEPTLPHYKAHTSPPRSHTCWWVLQPRLAWPASPQYLPGRAVDWLGLVFTQFQLILVGTITPLISALLLCKQAAILWAWSTADAFRASSSGKTPWPYTGPL